MYNIKYIDEESIKQEVVLVRVDFNVPIDETGQIADDRRIRAVLPTINYLLDEGCKVVLISHMGRPKGKRDPKYSLRPVAKRLSRLIEKDVVFIDDCIGEKVRRAVEGAKYGTVFLLENVRFYEGETKNDPEFAKALKESVGATCYVNDAFAVSHRKHASVVALAELFPRKYAGLLMKKELMMLSRILEKPKRPFAAIVGGAKVSDKIGALENLLNLVDKLLIGGAMAFTFLEYLGIKVGKSLVERDLIPTAGKVLESAKQKGVKVYLPVDCVVASSPHNDETKIVPVQEIPEDKMGLDIGPATITLFSEALADAKTIVWNGPMGYFEVETFAKGTYSIVSVLANSTAFTVVGGGDTDVAVTRMGEQHRISYISTGGGAFLEVLEGKVLPGIKVLME